MNGGEAATPLAKRRRSFASPEKVLTSDWALGALRIAQKDIASLQSVTASLATRVRELEASKDKKEAIDLTDFLQIPSFRPAIPYVTTEILDKKLQEISGDMAKQIQTTTHEQSPDMSVTFGRLQILDERVKDIRTLESRLNDLEEKLSTVLRPATSEVMFDDSRAFTMRRSGLAMASFIGDRSGDICDDTCSKDFDSDDCISVDKRRMLERIRNLCLQLDEIEEVEDANPDQQIRFQSALAEKCELEILYRLGENGRKRCQELLKAEASLQEDISARGWQLGISEEELHIINTAKHVKQVVGADGAYPNPHETSFWQAIDFLNENDTDLSVLKGAFFTSDGDVS